jgi:dipeptidyl aminopeptidase/acylaminoacyl peptidase
MLVARGIAAPERLGTMGISYGGFMSAWIITQDQRFAAAVATSPATNWYSQHRTSQIGFFDEYFLNGSAYEPGGLFFARSPVMFARNVKTPTLSLAGARDQNTPPTQALEFHRSLRENGVESALALYPHGVHGLMTFPEHMDATTRTIGWLLQHLGER